MARVVVEKSGERSKFVSQISDISDLWWAGNLTRPSKIALQTVNISDLCWEETLARQDQTASR